MKYKLGRNDRILICVITPGFALRDRGKPQRTSSLPVSGPRFEIRTSEISDLFSY